MLREAGLYRRILVAVLALSAVVVQEDVAEAARRRRSSQRRKNRAPARAPMPQPFGPNEPLAPAPPAAPQAAETPAEAAPAVTGSSSALVVRSSQKGATVLVDGTPVGVTPVRVDVAGGVHEITVTKDDFQTFNQAIQVSGEEVVLRVGLEPEEGVGSGHARKVHIMRGAGLGVALAGGAVSALAGVVAIGGAMLWVASAQALTYQRLNLSFTDPVSAALAPVVSTPVTLVAGMALVGLSPLVALLTAGGGAAVGLALCALSGDPGRYETWAE